MSRVPPTAVKKKYVSESTSDAVDALFCLVASAVLARIGLP